MSAREMFEKENYTDYFENDCRITYCNYIDSECKQIEFYKQTPTKPFNKKTAVSLADDTNEVIELSLNELKAINKQLEELGE